jgi:fatty-acyl-CoA synthase
MNKEDRYAVQLKQGRPMYGIELKVVDDSGKELPKDGESQGHLMVRGPWVLQKYFKAEKDAVDKDGWFDTGDISVLDQDGYMTIKDRAKDVIKSGGEWISSIDLENAAVGHPEVAEACVVGIPHPKWDERPMLFIVSNNGEPIDKQSILDFLASKVAKWWLPDEIIFLQELPHGATGKLQKFELREEYNNYYMENEMLKIIKPSEIESVIGTEVGLSDWIKIDQEQINKFAEATLDNQFIMLIQSRQSQSLVQLLLMVSFLYLFVLEFLSLRVWV